MFVSEIMSSCMAECTEDTKLEDAFELIQRCDHGTIVVVDSLAHRVPIGVVTERSICEQIIRRGRNPRSLTAGSVMDSRIKKVSSTDLVETLQRANNADVAAIVVVDDSRHACGLVSKDKIKTAVRPVNNYKPSIVTARPVQQTGSHRISEIPAFGWMS
jgi:CBS-domain-containing membrane protein